MDDGEEAKHASKTKTESSIRNGQLDRCRVCGLLGAVLVGIPYRSNDLAALEHERRRYSAKQAQVTGYDSSEHILKGVSNVGISSGTNRPCGGREADRVDAVRPLAGR